MDLPRQAFPLSEEVIPLVLPIRSKAYTVNVGQYIYTSSLNTIYEKKTAFQDIFWPLCLLRQFSRPVSTSLTISCNLCQLLAL